MMVVTLGAVLAGSLCLSYTTIANYKRLFMLTVIVILAILGLFYDPITAQLINQSYTDLYRIFNELNVFRNYGWNIQANIQGPSLVTTNYDAIIIAKIYMYTIAKVTTNNHILVLVNTLLTYGAMAGAVTFVGKKFHVSNFVIVSSFVFYTLVNDYSRVIANIRMPLAISLFVLLWSYEIYVGKTKVWVYFGYIAICLLHNAMFLFLVMKLLTVIIPRKATNLVVIIMLLSSVFLSPLVTLLGKLNSMGAIISGVLEKVVLYSETENMVGLTALLAQKQMVFIDFIRIVYFVILIYWVERVLRNFGDSRSVQSNSSVIQFIQFSKMLVAFTVGSIWSFNIFNRSALLMVALMPVLLIIVSQRTQVHVLSFKNVNLLVLANWAIVIISILYYFYGHTYQQLGM